MENDGLLTRVITNYSTLKEPFWLSQQGIPSNVFLIVRRISLIGSVFNIVLVEMDMCSGAFKVASFPAPKVEAAESSESAMAGLESVTVQRTHPNPTLDLTLEVRHGYSRETQVPWFLWCSGLIKART